MAPSRAILTTRKFQFSQSALITFQMVSGVSYLVWGTVRGIWFPLFRHKSKQKVRVSETAETEYPLEPIRAKLT